jgi:hypothetical protein
MKVIFLTFAVIARSLTSRCQDFVLWANRRRRLAILLIMNRGLKKERKGGFPWQQTEVVPVLTKYNLLANRKSNCQTP